MAVRAAVDRDRSCFMSIAPRTDGVGRFAVRPTPQTMMAVEITSFIVTDHRVIIRARGG